MLIANKLLGCSITCLRLEYQFKKQETRHDLSGGSNGYGLCETDCERDTVVQYKQLMFLTSSEVRVS